MIVHDGFCHRIGTVGIVLALCSMAFVAHGQMIGGGAEILTVRSPNGAYYLRSISFDNIAPSPRGVTRVYEAGNPTPLYEIGRAFDVVEKDRNGLILSNDGETIFHAITWGADDDVEEMRSISIYRHGQVLRRYTEKDINGCDKERERCSLLYSNYDQVVDRVKSRNGSAQYRREFKDGVSDEEKFLSDFALFNSGDAVYLTDSRKRTHLFSLTEGALTGSDAFENLYGSIKGLARPTKVEVEKHDMDALDDFPRVRGGGEAQKKLAAHLGMKVHDLSKDRQYRYYSVKVAGYITRSGDFEMEDLEVADGVSREKVMEFFAAKRFDGRRIPAVIGKWHVEGRFYFRKSDKNVARSEREAQLVEQQQEYELRITAESIEGVYIPVDLGEALVELDKLLPEVTREEMKALPKRGDMIRYHFGLGTGIRNTWGLWGGSRLQRYFRDRGVMHPDDMSGVILRYYHDWLHGRRDAWKEWEKNPGAIVE